MDEPTLADVIKEVESLRRRLSSAEARLPPPGWHPTNYAKDDDPGLALAQNCLTGAWSVWRAGSMIREGSSILEVARG